MKAIVLTLLLANLLLFGWFSINRPPGPESRDDTWNNSEGDQVPTIVLLSEAEKNQILTPQPKQIPVNERLLDENIADGEAELETPEQLLEPAPKPLPEPSPEPSTEPSPEQQALICVNVAMFDDEGQAVRLQEQLKESAIPSNIRTAELVDRTDYRVIMEPASTFEEAQQLSNALLEKGHENYIIASGNLRNGISLGLFLERQRADALKSEVEKAGFENLQIDETIKYKTNYTVYLQLEEADVEEKTRKIVIMGLEKPDPVPCVTNIYPPLEE